MTTLYLGSGVLFIIVGFVVWLLGYGIWRILLALTGAAYGYVAGTTLVGPEQGPLSFIIGIVGAIALALLAYFLWSAAALIYGMFLGIGVGAWSAVLLNIPRGSQSMPLFVIVGAIAGIVFAYFLKDEVIMLATALSGAAAILYGAQAALPEATRLTTGSNSIIGFFLWVIAGILGYAIQSSIFSGRRTRPHHDDRRAA